jgi:hypothetical protein
MTEADSFAARTAQKLRFAQIVLDELNAHPSQNSGDDFERSHHEAFFFHFYGAIDAFLQELNIYYACGLRIEQVSRRTLAEILKSRTLESAELNELAKLENEPESYLAMAKEIRHYVTHRGGLPMAHYFNGPSNLVHPVTRKEFKVDTLELLRGWLARLGALLDGFRTNAATRDA